MINELIAKIRDYEIMLFEYAEIFKTPLLDYLIFGSVEHPFSKRLESDRDACVHLPRFADMVACTYHAICADIAWIETSELDNLEQRTLYDNLRQKQVAVLRAL